MLTEKDHQAISEIIKVNTYHWQDPEAEPDFDDRPRLINDLADYFQADNPLFDKRRFIDACNENEVKP